MHCRQIRIPYFSVVRPKRLLKRSTRPPASFSFCLPVKKGWHLEQISTRISFLVEPVAITLPQAQVMVVCSYTGWMLSFMLVTSFGNHRLTDRLYHIRRKKARGIFIFFDFSPFSLTFSANNGENDRRRHTVGGRNNHIRGDYFFAFASRRFIHRTQMGPLRKREE